MFKRGDFIVEYPNKNSLYVAIDSTKMSMVASRWGIINTIGTIFTTWANDQLASNDEIKAIMKDKDLPQWVLDILNEVGKPNPLTANTQSTQYSIATIHPKVKLGFDLALPEIKQNNSIMTLQNFQNQCNHIYRDYYGFSRVYKYCIHCDKKDET